MFKYDGEYFYSISETCILFSEFSKWFFLSYERNFALSVRHPFTFNQLQFKRPHSLLGHQLQENFRTEENFWSLLTTGFLMVAVCHKNLWWPFSLQDILVLKLQFSYSFFYNFFKKTMLFHLVMYVLLT